MKELINRFNVYVTRLFFDGGDINFIDFIVIILFPIWGFLIGVIYLIIQLVDNILGGFVYGKK